MRFTDWVAVDDKEVAISVRAGLFQIRIKNGLLTYPKGKSAMYFYGYADNLQQGIANFQQTVLPLLKAEAPELLIRWMTATDFETRFKRHLDQFLEKFGSLPHGNVAILRQLRNL